MGPFHSSKLSQFLDQRAQAIGSASYVKNFPRLKVQQGQSLQVVGGSSYVKNFQKWKARARFLHGKSSTAPPLTATRQQTVVTSPRPIRPARVMRSPTIQWPPQVEYVASFQNPHVHLRNTELGRGSVALNNMGLPHCVSGNFACVFKVQTNSGVYAVRCFYNSKILDLTARYSSISNWLHRAKLPFFVDFVYIPEGIAVGNQKFPILRMEWAEGEMLDKFISRNVNSKDLLRKSAEVFIDSIIEMQKNLIAHGDLQHENIKISVDRQTNAIRIFFLDYDGLYVPDFRGSKSPELGHEHYQHPKRTENHYDERLDNFSALVIYLTILAIAENPALWKRYHGSLVDKYLIFRREDYLNPSKSPLIRELLMSNSGRIQDLADLLVQAINYDPLNDSISPDCLRKL